jgi:hypothetical protein
LAIAASQCQNILYEHTDIIHLADAFVNSLKRPDAHDKAPIAAEKGSPNLGLPRLGGTLLLQPHVSDEIDQSAPPTTALGPKPPIEDVRASVAIRGKPDVLCSA